MSQTSTMRPNWQGYYLTMLSIQEPTLAINISKSALNSLITHLQRVVERAKAEPKDCRTQDALRLLRAKDLPYLKRRLKSE